MNFDTLEKVFYSHSTNKIIPGLERIKILLERLGNPQNSFKAIHIVGTNGKGSTGAFLSSVFTASGYRTGFYSSPHLESPGERLLIDGEILPVEDWLSASDEVVKVIRPDEELPSYFEIITACAFVLMRAKKIDVGIIEAGLGGKFDATNVLDDCVCSVIASISIDHTEFLGNTLESIASEKFAVVKKNVPACFSGVDASLIPMFKDFCSEAGALPFIVSEGAKLENVKISPDGNIFDFSAGDFALKEIRTSLIGTYQISNAALALSALYCVKNSFPKITSSTIKSGMQKAKWPGRLEIISREPFIILDGGHNYDGVKKLCASVKELWPGEKFAVIYAAMKDKNFSGCLELLSELKPALYASTVPDMRRAASPEEILTEAKKFSWKNIPEGFSLPTEALKKALHDGNNFILICGSLYLIGWFKNNSHT